MKLGNALLPLKAAAVPPLALEDLVFSSVKIFALVQEIRMRALYSTAGHRQQPQHPGYSHHEMLTCSFSRYSLYSMSISLEGFSFLHTLKKPTHACSDLGI